MHWTKPAEGLWVNLAHTVKVHRRPDGTTDIVTVDGTVSKVSGPGAESLHRDLDDLVEKQYAEKETTPPDGTVDRRTTAELVVVRKATSRQPGRTTG